jgi:hypothetical protein
MTIRRLVIGIFLALPPWACAQTTDPDLIQKLLTRIDSLERRVAELEKDKTAAAAAAIRPVAPQPAVEAVHKGHDEAPTPQTVTMETPVYPSLKISGFSDFDFSATTLHGPSGGFGAQTLLGAHSGFEEGQFILHLSSALSPRVSVFGEVSLTARSDAGTGTPAAPGFNVELERMIIRYDWNDYFKISFGRYHTPINYWNTEYHHGQWLQTSISRPEMIQFGSSFMPVHFVGALVEGAVPAGGLNLNYNLGLGNGRGAVISRAGDFGDVNNDRAWLANLFVKPDFMDGLRVGGSVYRDEINQAASGQVAREWIQSGHIVWEKETPEVIAEFANVNHQPLNGRVASNSQALYIQTAYRLPQFEKRWKPYYRFEYTHVPQSDLIFKGLVPSFKGSSVGLRYDITTFAAFKFEYRHYIRPLLPSINGVFVQTSFTF